MLHRDISLGNILITDEAAEDGCFGFIHDFDYSSMTKVAPGEADDETSEEDIDDTRKERTVRCCAHRVCLLILMLSLQGTHYFIAHEILARSGGRSVIHRHYHDIESHYWVLLWIILRHTEHNLGQGYCDMVFTLASAGKSADAKMLWLIRRKSEEGYTLEIEDNKPLTDLMHAYKLLVKRNVVNLADEVDETPVLTHDAVLEIFDHALEQEGWPAKDYVACHLLNSTQDSASGAEPRSVFPQPGFVAFQPHPAAPSGRNAISAPADPCRLGRKRSSSVLMEETIPEGAAVSSDYATAGPSTLSQERDRSVGPSKRLKVASPSHSASAVMGPPPVPAHAHGSRRKIRTSSRAASTNDRSRR